MKLTDWYPPDVKPVRRGVYEVESSLAKRTYAQWSGASWRLIGFDIRTAARQKVDTWNQWRWWRGLAEKP